MGACRILCDGRWWSFVLVVRDGGCWLVLVIEAAGVGVFWCAPRWVGWARLDFWILDFLAGLGGFVCVFWVCVVCISGWLAPRWVGVLLLRVSCCLRLGGHVVKRLGVAFFVSWGGEPLPWLVFFTVVL